MNKWCMGKIPTRIIEGKAEQISKCGMSPVCSKRVQCGAADMYGIECLSQEGKEFQGQHDANFIRRAKVRQR